MSGSGVIWARAGWLGPLLSGSSDKTAEISVGAPWIVLAPPPWVSIGDGGRGWGLSVGV